MRQQCLGPPGPDQLVQEVEGFNNGNAYETTCGAIERM